MSIRLRLTLLYSTILALTLITFGIVLYTIQARYTLDALKRDLTISGERLSSIVLWNYEHPTLQNQEPPPPRPQTDLPQDSTFQDLRERDMVRVLDATGTLVASPQNGDQEALPLSEHGLQVLQSGQPWWQTGTVDSDRVLVYNRPVISSGELVYIVQSATPLTERDRSLAALATTLGVASLVTVLAAFGIGWALAGAALRPIHRITHTAQTIGSESDFTRRVDYAGPNDEVGQLATTFNSMLSRLQDAYQRVAHSLEMQRNFVADVSHELRTPLTTLRGNLGLLGRVPALPADEQADIVSDMVDESDRLIRLINDLLVLARADAGRSLSKEPLEAGPVLEEVCRQAGQLDPQRHIQLDINGQGKVLGDRDALKQVLLILMDNALKHTESDITASVVESDTQAVISVQDHGLGIPPDELERVFDRFYRGEDAMMAPGFGLGLPIAKALVEGMGGVIEIESNQGQGSLVRVRLPLASSPLAG